MATFQETGLDEQMLQAIGELGFVEPTPVQEKSIPEILNCGKDIVSLAQTGTGKTHLLKCMANEIIAQGKIAQIMTAFNLNQKFLEIHTASENEKENLIIFACHDADGICRQCSFRCKRQYFSYMWRCADAAERIGLRTWQHL